jgi:hypothetical protein
MPENFYQASVLLIEIFFILMKFTTGGVCRDIGGNQRMV